MQDQPENRDRAIQLDFMARPQHRPGVPVLGGSDPCPCGMAKPYAACCRKRDKKQGAIPPLAKLSDTLVEFAQPLLEHLPTKPSKERLVSILTNASMAWNSAIDPAIADSLWHALDRASTVTDDRAGAVSDIGRRMMALYMVRKAAFYPNDRRLIVLQGVRTGLDGRLLVSAVGTYVKNVEAEIRQRLDQTAATLAPSR